MKVKVIFPYKSNSESNKYSLTIRKNKIVKYNGLFPIGQPMIGYKRQFGEKRINSKFWIGKIDKHDAEDLNIKATHQISSQELHNVIGFKTFLNLNIFQSTYINWYRKKYLIQNFEFKKSIYLAILSAVIGILLTLGIQKTTQTNNEPNTPPRNATDKNNHKSLEKKIDTTTKKNDSIHS